jgi:hypothetical protein
VLLLRHSTIPLRPTPESTSPKLISHWQPTSPPRPSGPTSTPSPST